MFLCKGYGRLDKDLPEKMPEETDDQKICRKEGMDDERAADAGRRKENTGRDRVS